LVCGLLTIDPRDRLTLADAFQHPWCIRPSQLATQAPSVLAEHLTAPLRANGDMALAAPDLGHVMHLSPLPTSPLTPVDCRPTPTASDDHDPSQFSNSQFTQSLMLFVRPPPPSYLLTTTLIKIP
ncbi:hypothetical protein C0993_004275, partial [Termitomyces sp. T159_Od127]